MARARKDWKDELPDNEQPTDVDGLLSFLEGLANSLSDEDLAGVPTDFAVNFDHYAYGHPKQKP